jgi:hypothetical protein
VETRDVKIDIETQVKAKAKEYVLCSRQLDQLTAATKSAGAKLEAAKIEFVTFRKEVEWRSLDVDCYFRLKQGRVEVNQEGMVLDFSDAVMIHQHHVEELNKQIKHVGQEKVDILVQIRDFRKGIKALEWEMQRMVMELEDLKTSTQTFMLLRVTKDLQEMIKGGSEKKANEEISTLEKKISFLAENHLVKLAEKRKDQGKLGKSIAEKEAENSVLLEQIQYLQSAVQEREKITAIRSLAADETNINQKMQDITTRWKVKNLIRAQTEEIAILREELDKLRQATFPSFAVMRKQQRTGNPDERAS